MRRDWDRELTKRITDLGVDWERARSIVGMVAEERQAADREGYERGFESGHAAGVRSAGSRRPAPGA